METVKIIDRINGEVVGQFPSNLFGWIRERVVFVDKRGVRVEEYRRLYVVGKHCWPESHYRIEYCRGGA